MWSLYHWKGVLFSQQWVPSVINSYINRWEERDGNRTPPLTKAQLRLNSVTSSLAIPKIIEIMIFFSTFPWFVKGSWMLICNNFFLQFLTALEVAAPLTYRQHKVVRPWLGSNLQCISQHTGYKVHHASCNGERKTSLSPEWEEMLNII